MNVVILCGGIGMRAYPFTKRMPKALMPVGDAPIVEQVMRIYASFGYTDFVLSVGYLKEHIQEYFATRARQNGWLVRCVDTGDTTDTGGRVLGCREYVTDMFHATYCDGLGDVDLDALVDYHNAHSAAATMTAVPLRSQFGLVYSKDDGCVTHFEEKPVIPDLWINAGFFVFDKSVFGRWEGANLEKDVLPNLVKHNQVYTYRHSGFWRSMDTHKDQQELKGLWQPYSEYFANQSTWSQQPGLMRTADGSAWGGS
jgi:glucose-1-phosphate cytidylyltransferase